MTKLLVLDDSELIRSRLLTLLRGIPGVEEVLITETLAQALTSVREWRPNLAVLDLHVPGSNVIQFIPVLKKLAPELKVVVLANDSSDFSRRRCLDAGADWLFDKSTEFEALLALLAEQARAPLAGSRPSSGAPLGRS